jgi:hypothetical protein
LPASAEKFSLAIIGNERGKKLKKESLIQISLGVVLVLVSGCRTLDQMSQEGPPAYDKVHVYDQPYDFTYLRALEALNTFNDWILEETDKEKGLIVVRNTQYSHLFDKDKWVARFHVRRVDRMHTSVELDPVSQKLPQAREFMESLDKMIRLASAIKQEKISVAVPQTPV